MAHGSAILHICDKCDSFIYVNRFSQPEKCLNCGILPKQITVEKLREKYKISIFKEIPFNFNWTKIKNI